MIKDHGVKSKCILYATPALRFIIACSLIELHFIHVLAYCSCEFKRGGITIYLLQSMLHSLLVLFVW